MGAFKQSKEPFRNDLQLSYSYSYILVFNYASKHHRQWLISGEGGLMIGTNELFTGRWADKAQLVTSVLLYFSMLRGCFLIKQLFHFISLLDIRWVIANSALRTSWLSTISYPTVYSMYSLTWTPICHLKKKQNKKGTNYCYCNKYRGHSQDN